MTIEQSVNVQSLILQKKITKDNDIDPPQWLTYQAAWVLTKITLRQWTLIVRVFKETVEKRLERFAEVKGEKEKPLAEREKKYEI